MKKKKVMPVECIRIAEEVDQHCLLKQIESRHVCKTFKEGVTRVRWVDVTETNALSASSTRVSLATRVSSSSTAARLSVPSCRRFLTLRDLEPAQWQTRSLPPWSPSTQLDSKIFGSAVGALQSYNNGQCAPYDHLFLIVHSA